VQGLKCRRDLELGCSHISGLLVGRQMKPWALMDFRALRSTISLAASRAMAGDRVGKRRSDRFTISVTQGTLRNLGKSGFQVPTSVFAHTQFALRALSTAGGEPERKTAGAATLVER
jgi:hypothetical protein